jgi:endonuclease/exonuclease/phosphatase family metal-dependent hydrolase
MKTFVTFLMAVVVHSSVGQTVSVMSYNIRLDTKADGVNEWSNRSKKVASLIQKYDPDLVGVQEALHNQMIDLQKELPAYAFVGVGRDDGKEKGEYSAIFYKREKFEVVKQNTVWLSETPDVPGSKSWDAAITRIFTFAIFKHKDSGKSFVLLNTHFDHIGQQARLNSAIFIKGFVQGLNHNGKVLPIIVSGDFNSQPTEDPYQTMIREEIGVRLFDSRPTHSKAGTYCGFEMDAMECKTIDYIFHSSEWKTESYRVIQDNNGKYYPSDHLPVFAFFSLAK